MDKVSGDRLKSGNVAEWLFSKVPLQLTDDETLQKELSVLRIFNILVSREASFSSATNVLC